MPSSDAPMTKGHAICGRLLVGQGDDTYDPLCLRPAGHKDVCAPNTRWGCECGAIWTSDTTDPPTDRACYPGCPKPPLFPLDVTHA